MGLIDEKGRLFGKINIVDLFIIALIVVIIPGFVYAYKVLGKTPTRVPSSWVKVEAVTYTIPEIAMLFKPGDASYDEFGNPDGKLVKITEAEESLEVAPQHENRIPIILEFELSCIPGSVGEPWYFHRKPLVVSLEDKFTFTSDKYKVVCYPIKITPARPMKR